MFNFSKLKKSSKLYDEIQQQIKDTESKNQIISSIWRARSAFHLSLLRCAARPLIKVQWGKVQSLQVPRSQCVSVCVCVCICMWNCLFLFCASFVDFFHCSKQALPPPKPPCPALPTKREQQERIRERERGRGRERAATCCADLTSLAASRTGPRANSRKWTTKRRITTTKTKTKQIE